MDLNKRVSKTETISLLNGYRGNNAEPSSRVKWGDFEKTVNSVLMEIL